MTFASIRKLDNFKVRVVLFGAACTWLGPTATSAAAAPLFLPVVAYSSGGSSAASVATTDVDGDGELDLVVASCGDGCFQGSDNGTVSVLLGAGDGTFQPARIFGSGGIGAQSVAVADLDSDGRPDILVTNLFSHSVGVLLGNGDGTFQPVTTYASGGVNPWSVAVADVNGDRHPDLLVANSCNAELCSGGLVSVLLGNGDGTLQQAATYVGFNAQSLAVADLNGDGHPDMLVGSGFFTVVVLLGNGDGTFQAAVSYDAGGFGQVSVAAADVNQDNHLDLVVALCAPDASMGCGGTSANTVVGVLLGNGDGTLQPVMIFPTGERNARAVAVADVNHDRKPDLLVAHDCDANGNCAVGTVSVLLGEGTGAFAPAVAYNAGGPSALGVTSLAVADLNSDGEPDVIAGNADGTVGVLLHAPRSDQSCRHPVRRSR